MRAYSSGNFSTLIKNFNKCIKLLQNEVYFINPTNQKLIILCTILRCLIILKGRKLEFNKVGTTNAS